MESPPSSRFVLAVCFDPIMGNYHFDEIVHLRRGEKKPKYIFIIIYKYMLLLRGKYFSAYDFIQCSKVIISGKKSSIKIRSDADTTILPALEFFLLLSIFFLVWSAPKKYEFRLREFSPRNQIAQHQSNPILKRVWGACLQGTSCSARAFGGWTIPPLLGRANHQDGPVPLLQHHYYRKLLYV